MVGKKIGAIALLALTVLTTGCVGQKKELTISAAASMTDALKELAPAFEDQLGGVKLSFNFGGSGALAQQIEQGAPVDLFLSAAPKNMQTLADKQLVDPAKVVVLLKNELVVVVPSDSNTMPTKLEELANPGIRHLAIGEPLTVPAGSYAQEALEHMKLWETVQPKLVPGKDVRQVLAYVESGNAEAGFVYKTDARTSKKVKVALSVDSSLYDPIEYPAAVVKASKHLTEADYFLAFLQSDAARQVFAKYGFAVPK